MKGCFSPLSVAPMMQWTHRHFRFLLRLLSPHALLYTEMYNARTIIHAHERALGFVAQEMPLAVQIGSGDVQDLAQAVAICNNYGFCEINLNLGCPSQKVQTGGFGAVLLHDPDLVGKLITTMKLNSHIPVSVKIRIGVDDKDSYAYLSNFVRIIVDSGCDKIIVHARKALLSGVSTKENRSIPPINYEFVYRLRQDFDIPIVINGEIDSLLAVQNHLRYVDGVMIGRAVCKNPYLLAEVSSELYVCALPDRKQVLAEFMSYAREAVVKRWLPSQVVTSASSLYKGMQHARHFRFMLSQYRDNIDVLCAALCQQGFLDSNI